MFTWRGDTKALSADRNALLSLNQRLPPGWEMVRVLQEDPIGGNWVKGTQGAFLKNFLLNVNLQLRYNMKFNLQMCVRIKFF